MSSKLAGRASDPLVIVVGSLPRHLALASFKDGEGYPSPRPCLRSKLIERIFRALPCPRLSRSQDNNNPSRHGLLRPQ